MERIEQIRYPVGIALGLPQEVIEGVDLATLYLLGDAVDCKYNDGQDMDLSGFTGDTWKTMHEIQALGSTNLTGDDLDLINTKMLQGPMEILKYKVDKILDRIGDEETFPVYDRIKMYVHDGNDSSMLLLLNWLKPSNLSLPIWTHFSSQLTFELLHSDKCLLV